MAPDPAQSDVTGPITFGISLCEPARKRDILDWNRSQYPVGDTRTFEQLVALLGGHIETGTEDPDKIGLVHSETSPGRYVKPLTAAAVAKAKEAGEELSEVLMTEEEVAEACAAAAKERVGLWIPATFKKGKRRSLENVLAVSCLVLDFDDGHDPDDFMEGFDKLGLRYIVHSSHSHTPEKPKWRAIFPLLNPVLASEWGRTWAKLEDALGYGVTDPSCKDATRMYYLPSCPAGAQRLMVVRDGKLLDPGEFPELPEVQTPASAPSSGTIDGDRPGDDFERRATWEEILNPHGFVPLHNWRGQLLWRRPGKTRGSPSLKTGPGSAGDRCWVYSSNAGLPVQTILLKFAVYAHLNHGGDYGAAASELRKKGYGSKPKEMGLGLRVDEPGRLLTPATLSQIGDGDAELTAYMASVPAAIMGRLLAGEITRKDVFRLHPPPEGAQIPGYNPPKKKTELKDAENAEQAYDEGFDATDLGNGKRFVERFKGDARYVGMWGAWLHWSGTHWAKDAPENPTARRKAHVLAEEMLDPEWHQDRKAWKAWAVRSRSSDKISSLLTEAKARPGVAIKPDVLDTHDWILPCRNGVVDLKTGKLHDHDSALMYTKIVPHDYDPDAKCPRFEQFLLEITKERLDLVDLIVCLLGYSVCGCTREHKWALLYGERGRNGKSTLLETSRRILGEYCGVIDRALLIANRFGEEAKFSKAEIEGRRMVYASEVKKSGTFNSDFINDLTGADTMRAERKGKDGYSFPLKVTLWYAVNELPRTNFDSAFGARILPIPFEQSFYAPTDTEYRDGDLPPDRTLSEALIEESSGILTLMVNGCLRWQESGFPISRAVNSLVAEYRDENDAVGMWIAERMTYKPGHKVLMTELFTMFNKWAESLGMKRMARINEFHTRLRRDPQLLFTKPNNKSVVVGLIEGMGQDELPDLNGGE